ncbi:MAG: Hsp20/alpha crystallin family protein [Acidobacteria bacterium]|nr:MAG: Hsp20/alpha crystallin family protein [Acidobacteriota bacterium]
MRASETGRHPFEILSGLEQDLTRILDGLGLPGRGRRAAEFLPPVDVRETDSAVVIEADLPGVPREAIDLRVEGGMLLLTGERPRANGAGIVRSERPAGRFRRSFRLPPGADPSRITAGYEAGVLTITIPKREEARVRRIEVSG